MSAPLRVGNCSGFYGDRLAAMREMLDGGSLDVLTGDYLAELTMLILFRSRAKDPTKGYATTFLRQLEDCLGLVRERGIRLVADAGGLNPAGCAQAVRDLAARLGIEARVSHVEGDDLLARSDELGLARGLPTPPVTANAYLGAWGIVEALRGGADIVVTGRVTDASLVVGPAAWHHGWNISDYDALAGAVVAGHVLECGAQACGGNYAFFTELAALEQIGFPIAEVSADGSSVITKHDGTDGAVTVGTVTAQLLYEIGDAAYLGPDVTAHFDTIALSDDGADRVRISGVRGSAPPSTVKVCLNRVGGFRNSVTFLLTGLDIEAKAALVERQLRRAWATLPPASVEFRLAETVHDDPDTNPRATTTLTVWVKDADGERVGRAFSNAAVELALASYPGCTLTAPPAAAAPYGVYSAAYVPARDVTTVVVHHDRRRVELPAAEPVDPGPAVRPHPAPGPPTPGGPTIAAPLGRAFGARSGDKGGTANLGVWARNEAGYAWLHHHLTVAELGRLLPETAGLAGVQRVDLPNLRAVNFVLPGLLGEGVSSSTRPDPQAKGLGEWLRARVVDLPEGLIDVP